MLDNLVSNAVRYSPEGGEVTLSAQLQDDGLAVSVVDQGLGLSADDLDRVFERFWRSNRAEIKTIKGTGLGLAVSQAIVEAQGGSIRAESDGLNKGSPFVIQIPIKNIALDESTLVATVDAN